MAKQIRDNHQVEEVQDEYDEIIGIISTIDIGEEPAKDETIEVQVQHDGEDDIDDTRRVKKQTMRTSTRAWVATS